MGLEQGGLDVQGGGMSGQAEAVKAYLLGLQDRLCGMLEAEDMGGRFREDVWDRAEGGGGITRVLEGGEVWEKAGVNFSDVSGEGLPSAATARRPELAGRPFRGLGVSVVVHPLNPHVPASHMNVRYFEAGEAWWFGGGFDLTPYYVYEEDAVTWHRAARAACARHGAGLYERFKRGCDEYFYLPHRGETRGVGGLFFDDYTEGGFGAAFGLATSVGDAYGPVYGEIARRRKGTPYGQRELRHQELRRGRYVEFNLVYDRGTLFGLQSGGRVESVLMSLPPRVRWGYRADPEPGSREERELREYFRPREWLEGQDGI